MTENHLEGVGKGLLWGTAPCAANGRGGPWLGGVAIIFTMFIDAGVILGNLGGSGFDR